jgi:hypothetical protein
LIESNGSKGGERKRVLLCLGKAFIGMGAMAMEYSGKN